MRSAVLVSALVAAASLVLSACGGDISPNQSGGTGAGNTGECPVEEPSDGAPCSLPADVSCAYGACCPPQYHCEEGTWKSIVPPCLPPDACPAEVPGSGQPCDFCFQDSPCVYDRCSEGMGVVTSTCDETGIWISLVEPCADCGEVTCKGGEICVETAGGPGISRQCVENPCAPAPLSCDCAGELCGGEPFVCSVTGSSHLSCACAMCP